MNSGHLPRTRGRILVGWACVALTLGCGSGTEPGGQLPGPGPDDDRGLRLGSVEWADNLVWNADGTELFFRRGPTPYRISSVPTTPATPRIVYTRSLGPSFPGILFLRRPGSNDDLYFAESSQSADHVVRIDPAAASPQPGILASWPGRFVGNFVVSATGRFLGVRHYSAGGADVGEVIDRSAGTSFLLPAGAPWSFSPDEATLLYRLFGGATLQLISTTDESARAVTLSGPVVADLAYGTGPGPGGAVHYWKGGDPNVILADTVSSGGTRIWQISEQNLNSGAVRNIGSIPYARITHYELEGAVSADGEHIAVWDFGSDFQVVHLLLVAVNTGSVSTVATIDRRGEPGYFFPSARILSIAFSPVSRRLAYALELGASRVDIHLLNY